MKTAINQSATVFTLFILACGATLAISWGIIQLVYPAYQSENILTKSVLIKQVEQEVQRDFTRTFKYLIPKLK